MKIAFYVGGDSFFAKLVQWYTRSPESHCELIFSDGQSFSADIERWRTCFATKDFSNTEKWVVYDLPAITEAEEAIIRKFCVAETGCWYDIIGIFFSIVLPFGFQSPWWWFCSEVCTAALQQIGLLQGKKAWRVTPGELRLLIRYKSINPRIVTTYEHCNF